MNYYNSASQQPLIDKPSAYPNMTYSAQGGLPPGSSAPYPGVPVSVGFANPSQPYATSPIYPPANSYRHMTPTSYMNASTAAAYQQAQVQGQAAAASAQAQAQAAASSQYCGVPASVQSRYPVASPSFPSGPLQTTPSYPSYLAHNSVASLNSSLPYPGSSNSNPSFPGAPSYLYAAGPPAYSASPYPGNIPTAAGQSPYTRGVSPAAAAHMYPGSAQYLPRP